MFCNKCGTKLPSDSEFCIKCGSKLELVNSMKEEGTSISRVRKGINKISKNPSLNIFCIIIFIIALIAGYKLIKSNLSDINYNKELAEITEDIIELKESSTFLGSSYSEKQDLEEYKSQINKGYLTIVISSVMIIISLFGGTFLVSELIKLRKKREV